MFKERLAQVGSMSDTAGGFARLSADALEVFADELGHVGTRQVAPEIFHGVKFRCVGRQILHGEPRRLLGNPCLHLFAAVSRQPVPQQDGFATAKVPLQRPQIRQDLRLFDRSRSKTQTQPDLPGRRRRDQAGDGRQSLPVEWSNQNRRLTTRCPSPTHAGTLRKPAFVEENQQCLGLPRLFLIRGQR